MKKSKLTSIAAILLAVAMLLAMAACGDKENAEGSPNPNSNADNGAASEVTMILPSDTATLAPFEGESGGRAYTLNTFYERLGVMDQRGEDLTLVLLKSYEKVADKEYKLVLYDNIYDIAGNHITASDVKYCYDIAKEKTVFQSLVSFDRMEVEDDEDEYTLTMYLKEETMGVLINVLQAVPIVSQAAYEASEDGYVSNPIGTTGYKCTSFVEGSGYTAEWVGTWRSEDQPAPISFSHTVDKINYLYIAETSQMRMALENGDADVCFNLLASDLDKFRQTDGFEVNEDIDNRITIAFYNCAEGKAFSDIHLRKAASYAIDREAINEFVFNGLAAMPNAVCGVNLIDYNKDWDTDGYYDYDVDAAKAEFEQADYDGRTITIMTTTNADFKAEAELIATYLEAIGIKCKLSVMEDSLIESTASDADAWDIYLGPRGSEDYMCNIWMRWVPADNYDGVTQNFVDDAKLQDYYNKIMNVETYSVDLVNEASQYLEDQCYAYTILQAPTYCTYNSNLISAIALNYKAFPLANAFTYN